MKLMCPLIVSFLLSACVGPGDLTTSNGLGGAVSRQIPIGDNFVTDKLSWDGSIGYYSFQWKAVPVNGKFEICGAGIYSTLYIRSQSIEFMRRAKFTLNGQVILRDARFFSELPVRSNFRGGIANCRATGVDVPSGEWTVNMPESIGRSRF